ncbi:hypothetical protein P7K49_008035, partial [Saguinus oedipus]
GIAWKIQEPGRRSLTLTCFRVAQEATDRCPSEEKRHVLEAAAHDSSSSWDPPSSSSCSPSWGAA